MMDIFAAKHLLAEEESMTHDDVISALVKLADPETFEEVKKLEEKKKQKK